MTAKPTKHRACTR